MTPCVEQRIARVFEEAGVRGWLHARPARSGRRTPAIGEICYDADQPVAIASLYKLLVLVAYLQAVDAGELDPTGRTRLLPADRIGYTGTSVMHDAVELSWRDAVTSMITVSDEAAARAVVDRLGAATVGAVAQHLELTATRFRPPIDVVGPSGATGSIGLDGALEVAESAGGARAAVAASRTAVVGLDVDPDPDAYNADLATSSTARDLTTLLAALAGDTAARPASCRFARELLTSVHGPYRLRLGFALDTIVVGHKTGTLSALRHDAGLVRFAGEPAYAVCVLTRAARPDRVLPVADAAIGAAARLAVDELRRRAVGTGRTGISR